MPFLRCRLHSRDYLSNVYNAVQLPVEGACGARSALRVGKFSRADSYSAVRRNHELSREIFE